MRRTGIDATPPSGPAPRRGAAVLRALAVSLVSLVIGGAVFLVLFGFEMDTVGTPSSIGYVLLVFLDIAAGIAASIAVGPVRRSLVGNLLIVCAATVSTWAVAAGIVSIVRLGSRRVWPLDIAVVAVMVVGSIGHTLVVDAAATRASEDLLWIAVLAVAVTAGLLLWGRARGTRAALVDALRAQAASAQESQDAVRRSREAEIASARAQERTAIARDMHDGISHQLAVVAMHAGALEYRSDLTAEQQRSAAGTVRRAASDASVMLREALEALRDVDGAATRRPLPDAASIDRLVDSARADGHDISLDWVGVTPEDLPDAPGRAVACASIVAELVMNARKYAPDAPVRLRIEGADDGALMIRSSNPLGASALTATGTGLGLVGVAERAAALGGSATSGPTPSGTFDVEVRLP